MRRIRKQTLRLIILAPIYLMADVRNPIMDVGSG